MRRWISCVRPPICARSRYVRVCVARGSIAYSAVSQPSPLAALPAGHAILDGRRAQHARVPKETRQEPSAYGARALDGDGAQCVDRATDAHGDFRSHAECSMMEVVD